VAVPQNLGPLRWFWGAYPLITTFDGPQPVDGSLLLPWLQRHILQIDVLALRGAVAARLPFDVDGTGRAEW